MDKIDFEIIKILMNDAQTPFTKIAKELDIGVDTVNRRYTRMKNEGIIQKASIVIDIEKCGVKGFVSLLITTQSCSETSKIFEAFAHFRNVVVVTKTIGDSDLMVEYVFSDINDLSF